MLYLTCTTITSVDLAHYGVSRAKDWVSVYCGTTSIFTYFLVLYLTRITQNNHTPCLKSLKNQNRRAALGQPAIKLLGYWGGGGGGGEGLQSTNPRR